MGCTDTHSIDVSRHSSRQEGPVFELAQDPKMVKSWTFYDMDVLPYREITQAQAIAINNSWDPTERLSLKRSLP